MPSLQLQLSTSSRSCQVSLSQKVLGDLQWWFNTENFLQGQSLVSEVLEMFLYADTSLNGWGVSILEMEVSGCWLPHEQQEHIALLELRTIQLGLQSFEALLQGETVAVLSDNTTAVSYLKKAGGTRSLALIWEAQETLQWTEDNSVAILTQFVRGETNIVADCLNRRNQVISTEWVLHHHVCSSLWRLWGSPLLNLFATRLNHRLPNFVSPFPDPLVVAMDAFLFPWHSKELYAFLPFHIIRKVINKLYRSEGV